MFTKTFTDPQGVTHTDAVFETSMATYNENVNESYDFRVSQGDDDSNKFTNTSHTKDMNYQMYYWTSQAARDAGLLPYILANTNPVGDRFYITKEELDKPEYSGLSAAAKAERHCEFVVLA